MNHATTDQAPRTDRTSDGLLAGIVASALFALVFGICFWTILDATHSYPEATAPMKIATMKQELPAGSMVSRD
jgi:hypothetical protein